MGPDPDRHVASAQVADVQRMCTEFAAAYPELRLYRAICEGAATDDEVAGLLTAARPGQARPVLLLAALHELVLRRPDLPAARWYPSVTGGVVPEGDPWPDVRRTARAHAEDLRAVIGSRSTQTNEVNRVVHLAPLLAQAAADVPDSPVALVEVGASAGLLLGLDRYRIEVTPSGADRTGSGDEGSRRGGGAPVVLGDPTSPVVCAGVQRDGASMAGLRLPPVVARVGLDRSPVPLDDADEVRWLEACLWPDVPGRLERFRAAVALLRADPPSLVAGDMVDDLEAVAHSVRAVATAGLTPDRAAPDRRAADRAADRRRPEPVHLVVVSSWALTYVARERRPEVGEALDALAADGRPVSWLTAEPPGCVPAVPRPAGDGDRPPTEASTILGARRWRAGVELPPARWGTSHPHGTTLSWHPTP